MTYVCEIPLRDLILKVVSKKEVLTNKELFEILRRELPDLRLPELNKELMKLEIEGLIHVSRIKEGEMRIELLKGKGDVLAVGED